MNINSASLSIITGIIFISITFICIVIICIFIYRSKLTADEKTNKVIELMKWAVGSIALVICSSIISDSFKERQADKDQMTAFNTYITYVTDSGTLAKKW